MTSAVLTTQNESMPWSHSRCMEKLANSNHVNPNPNPNSAPKKKHRPVQNGRPTEDSDDAYSFNQKPVEQNGYHPNFNPGAYVSLVVSNCTKTELAQIRKRLVSELDSIRRLNLQIESEKFNTQKKKRPNPIAQGTDSKKLRQQVPVLDAAEMENLMKMCKQVLSKLMKQKLSWVFNKPVDAAALGLHDYHHIVKQPMDLGTVKLNLGRNFYPSPSDFAADVRLTFENALLYNPQGDEVHKMADQLLARFEELYKPIQAKYKIESRDVEIDELQGSSWNASPAREKPKKSKSKSKLDTMPQQMPVLTPKQGEKMGSAPKKSGKMEIASKKIDPLSNEEMAPNPPSQPIHPPAVVKPSVGRPSSGKLPKPRAKDPNKRAMSMEEKHKLSIGLQSLPQEKMAQLVHIIKKRNAHMVQEGDEIELDIEAIDTETLWELDRFVTNWKKMASKIKRQVLMPNPKLASAPAESETASGEDNVVSASERLELVKKLNAAEGAEGYMDGGDDVDIDDDMPMSRFAPVEIEKDEGGGGTNENCANDNNNGRAASSSSSSSGSSSSDSSSSSGSDSGSSSGTDSDADDAQSKGLEAQDPSKQRLPD